MMPDQVLDFNVLYRQNCSGCHGIDGKNGPATPLADPVYLMIADDATIRKATANGIPGTTMPAFAQSAGGMLTDKQVDALVSGIRSHWAKTPALAGISPPPYSAHEGDAARGAGVYASYCAGCHGAKGAGGPKGGSIVDGSYLALVSDQGLRTDIILGRPELGFPDWRNDSPGKPMSSQEISDVVAWMAAQRPRFPGNPYPLTASGGQQ
jgi:mono/diheme cytochrome c family protein